MYSGIMMFERRGDMKKEQSKTTKATKATKTTKATPATPTFDPAVLEMLNPNAAGIDVSSEDLWVCVPANRATVNVRKFGVYTDQLVAIADWLTECGVTSVAMESTGVYWIPLYQVLEERGFAVCLTNAKHLKNVSGRPKTDRLDCQWIQRLHSYGFLLASFRPTDEICRIRSIQRHRDSLIQDASRHVQHMQKALHQMNVLLPKVVKDITGVTGMSILQKILDGERNPVKLAKLRKPQCKSTEDEIARALNGDYRSEHLFVLRQAHTAYGFVQRQLRECDREIERLLTTIDKQIDANQTPPPPRTKPQQPKRKNQHHFSCDARTLLYECFGTDVTELTGIETTNGLELYTEVGADMSAWATDQHFTSWLGLSPNAHSSGGKMKSSQTRKVTSRAAQIFRLAAKSASRSKTYLGAFYRRMKARIGAPKAMTATARKIAVIFYHMVKERVPFRDLGEDYYMAQNKERALKRLQRQAKQMGYTLVEQQV
jgi:transposase